MAVAEKIKEIVAQQLGVNEEQITDSASFQGDLGADSLEIVELAMALEEEFDVDIPDEDLPQIQTFGQAVSYIESRAGEKS